MTTIPLSLEGYTDLPPGKIANVVTYFEMTAPPTTAPRASHRDLSVRQIVSPDLAWYRDLYRRVGEPWLWFSRAIMSDEKLQRHLADPATEIHVLERGADAIGLAELTRGDRGEIEIDTFGVVPEATGSGAARFLMEEVLSRTWSPGVSRVWLHTCTFDHPAAIPFYLARGFRPYKFAIEVSDDPRLLGYLPESAAPHVPVIKPRFGYRA